MTSESHQSTHEYVVAALERAAQIRVDELVAEVRNAIVEGIDIDSVLSRWASIVPPAPLPVAPKPRKVSRRGFERLVAGDHLQRYGALPDPDPPSEITPCDIVGAWSEQAAESLEERIDRTTDGEAEWTVFRTPAVAVEALLRLIKHPLYKRMVEQYYLGSKEATLKSVGDQLGLSRERIRQIVRRSLREILAALKTEREAVRRRLDEQKREVAEAVNTQREREAARRNAERRTAREQLLTEAARRKARADYYAPEQIAQRDVQRRRKAAERETRRREIVGRVRSESSLRETAERVARQDAQLAREATEHTHAEPEDAAHVRFHQHFRSVIAEKTARERLLDETPTNNLRAEIEQKIAERRVRFRHAPPWDDRRGEYEAAIHELTALARRK